MAEANVITTCETPASIAEKEFSSFGIIPPWMMPFSTYSLKSSGVMTGITLSSSFSSRRTPFFSKQNTSVTSNNWANALAVSAKAAVVLCGDTGEVIFSKNENQKLSMASTTKIMTGLLLCEYGNFEREITVTKEMLRVEGSSMGLLAGDKVTLHDLLYGLMLASGNDAANVIAFVLGGSVDGFVQKMNQKAEDLGLENTRFATPSGLDDENHYTTALELAKLTRYALCNEEFAKVVACEKAPLNYGNPPYKRSLTNHNKLLKTYDGAVGVKTGFTKKSGRCLVGAAERDGVRFLC